MFIWDEYLKFAEALSNKENPEEVDCRISISRAYYGVFNKCHDKFFEFNTLTRQQSDSHKFIIDKFKEGKREAKAIGFHLDSLKVSRISSDYKKNEFLTSENMKASVKLAKLINEKLNSINEDHFN